MKKFRIFLLLIVGVFILPFMVNAATPDNPIDEESNEVRIYLFRGEGCPHCEEAIEWLDSIEKEYGSKFQIISYEVWNNTENSNFMNEVAKVRGEEPTGVPYILIGDKTWYGFDESYKSEMLEEIEKEYKQDVKDRYDILEYVKTGKTPKKSSDSGVDTASLITLVIVVVVIGGIAGGTYYFNKKKEN